MIELKKTKATTLVEIILYFSLVGVFLYAGMIFAIQILKANSLTSTVSEWQANWQTVSERIISAIQEAESVDVNASVFNNLEGVLVLNMPDPLESPKRFYLDEGNVYYQEAGGVAVRMNSEAMIFEQLEFERMSFNQAPDHIIIDATVAPVNQDIAHFRRSKAFHLAVSLRSIQ